MTKSKAVVLTILFSIAAIPWGMVLARCNPVTAVPVTLDVRDEPDPPEIPAAQVGELVIELPEMVAVATKRHRRIHHHVSKISCWRHLDDSSIMACGYAGHPLNPRNAIDESKVAW